MARPSPWRTFTSYSLPASWRTRHRVIRVVLSAPAPRPLILRNYRKGEPPSLEPWHSTATPANDGISDPGRAIIGSKSRPWNEPAPGAKLPLSLSNMAMVPFGETKRDHRRTSLLPPHDAGRWTGSRPEPNGKWGLRLLFPARSEVNRSKLCDGDGWALPILRADGRKSRSLCAGPVPAKAQAELEVMCAARRWQCKPISMAARDKYSSRWALARKSRSDASRRR